MGMGKYEDIEEFRAKHPFIFEAISALALGILFFAFWYCLLYGFVGFQ